VVVGFGGAEGGYEEMKGDYLGGWFAVCGLRTDRRMDGWVHDRLCINVALFLSLFSPFKISNCFFPAIMSRRGCCVHRFFACEPLSPARGAHRGLVHPPHRQKSSSGLRIDSEAVTHTHDAYVWLTVGGRAFTFTCAIIRTRRGRGADAICT